MCCTGVFLALIALPGNLGQGGILRLQGIKDGKPWWGAGMKERGGWVAFRVEFCLFRLGVACGKEDGGFRRV